jgi:hypothetical protein
MLFFQLHSDSSSWNHIALLMTDDYVRVCRLPSYYFHSQVMLMLDSDTWSPSFLCTTTACCIQPALCPGGMTSPSLMLCGPSLYMPRHRFNPTTQLNRNMASALHVSVTTPTLHHASKHTARAFARLCQRLMTWYRLSCPFWQNHLALYEVNVKYCTM